MVNWEEVVTAYFKTLSQHLPGKNEENHDTISQDNQPPIMKSRSKPAE
jgi:hypothetical protein